MCELNLVARAAQHDEPRRFDGAVQGVGVGLWVDDEVGVARDDDDGQSYRVVLWAERREARVEGSIVAERGFDFARPRPERLRLFEVAGRNARGRERFFEAVSDLPSDERTRCEQQEVADDGDSGERLCDASAFLLRVGGGREQDYAGRVLREL